MKRTLLASAVAFSLAAPAGAASIEVQTPELDAQIKQLQQAVDALEKAEPDVDLSGIRDRLEALDERLSAEEAKQPSDLSGLKGRVSDLESTLSDVQATLNKMQGDGSGDGSDGDSGGSDGSEPQPEPEPTPEPDPAPKPDPKPVTCDTLADINSQYAEYRPACDSNIIHVGADREQTNPFTAIRNASAGDFVLIHGGTYTCEGSPYHHEKTNALVRQSVAVIGVGDVHFGTKYVHKGCITTHGGGKPNPNWLYVENIKFSGANNGDFNGAGIRHESGSLTVVASTFTNNQNGILGGGEGKTVRIVDSTFRDNGHGDGQSHGIYINDGSELVVEGSTFTGTNIGHHVKSLAQRTVVRNSTLGDGNDTASMAVDVTAGGGVLIEGNRIVQSADSGGDRGNPHIVWYDVKRGPSDEPGSITIKNNEIVNQYASGSVFGAPSGLSGIEVELTGNTITTENGGSFKPLLDKPYTSTDNTLNGEPIRDGYHHPDWPVLASDISYPEYVQSEIGRDIPLPTPVQTWMTGKHLVAGWGKHTLKGTDKRDVMEARSKGTKTLKGGAGDDVYLLWGSNKVVDDQGFDWELQAAASGGWAYRLPGDVEGLVRYANTVYDNAIKLNDADNVAILGRSGKDEVDALAGDDVIYTPVVGGAVEGGKGRDTLILPCTSTDATIQDGSVTCAGGTVSISNVERLVFSDKEVEN
jgi:hypothetical protein